MFIYIPSIEPQVGLSHTIKPVNAIQGIGWSESRVLVPFKSLPDLLRSTDVGVAYTVSTVTKQASATVPLSLFVLCCEAGDANLYSRMESWRGLKKVRTFLGYWAVPFVFLLTFKSGLKTIDSTDYYETTMSQAQHGFVLTYWQVTSQTSKHITRYPPW